MSESVSRRGIENQEIENKKGRQKNSEGDRIMAEKWRQKVFNDQMSYRRRKTNGAGPAAPLTKTRELAAVSSIWPARYVIIVRMRPSQTRLPHRSAAFANETAASSAIAPRQFLPCLPGTPCKGGAYHQGPLPTGRE